MEHSEGVRNLGKEHDSPADIACLIHLRGQLECKVDILIKLDSLVVEYIDDESELKAKVCETVDIQASVPENISQINGFVASRERQLPTTPITTSNPQHQHTVQPEAMDQTQ